MIGAWISPQANGAGIAADPTLTDAWPCSFNIKFKGRVTWHPMFSLPLHPKMSLSVLSPALAPASGSTLHSARRRSRHDPKNARLPCPAALQRAVPQPCLPLVAGGSNGHIAFRSEDLYTTPPSPILPGRPGSPRKTFALPSSTRLASGMNLRHEGLEKRADRSRGVFPGRNSFALSSR